MDKRIGRLKPSETIMAIEDKCYEPSPDLNSQTLSSNYRFENIQNYSSVLRRSLDSTRNETPA